MRYVGTFPSDLVCGPMWPQVSAMLAASLPYGRGEYDLEDIHAGLKDRSLTALGSSVDGVVGFVAVCSVQAFPRKTVLYVVHGAGRAGAECAGALTTLAKDLGCDWIETRTRPSVARLYKRLGFNTEYTVPILEINQ